MLFYLRFILVAVCFILCSFVGTLYAVLRWGNPNTNRHIAHAYAWLTLKILGLRVEVEGLEHLKKHKSCVYVANHQSGLDMSLFGAIYPHRALIIGKKELLWIPVFGIFFVAAGNILIHRQKRIKAVQTLGDAVESLRKKKSSIWIFPEGTRNKGGGDLLPFKRGAFHIALQAGIPIVPLVCSPLHSFFDWEKKFLKPGVVKIKVLPPVDVTDFKEQKIDDLVQKVRNNMLEALRGLQIELEKTSLSTHPHRP